MDMKKIGLMGFIILVLCYSFSGGIVYGDEDSLASNGAIKSIKIAVDLDMPPLQYQENNSYKGFNIDILEGIAEFQSIEIIYVPMALEISIKALEKGEVDAILGVNYLANLSENLMFTENILTSSVGLITTSNKVEEREENLELTDMIIALKRQTVEYQYLQNVRRVQYNTTSNQVDAFYLLLEGRADSLMGDKIITQYLLKKHQLEGNYEFINSYIIPIEYSIAVYKDNHNLLYILNSGLRQVKERGIYGEIYDTWFGEEDLLAQKKLQQVMKAFVFFIIITIVVFVISIRWNNELKKEVNKKTKQLREINKDLENQIKETRNKNELINQILESSPRGMVTFSREGRIASCNPRAAEIMGIHQNPVGMNYKEIPLFFKLLKDKIEKVTIDGMQFLSEETEWTRQDGGNHSIRYMIYPLKNYEKVITGMMISFEDNTEEKEIRAALFAREKSRALHDIVAGIAHEIRNPLTSIKTFVELIPEKLNNPNFQRDIISYVPKEVERVNQLIENLIDYAKPKKPNKEQVNVNDLIESCCGLYKPVLEKKGFLLDVQIQKDLKIQADKSQIKQVIINFIINGIEAMEEIENERKSPLVLSISGWKDAKHIYLQVKDEGAGMTEEEINNALNPFYTTKMKGTGLGLTLSKQSIEENGGQLMIESKKNIGTSMIITFQRSE
ncbi:amino acid-binding domain sensor histidine kinase [Natronincola peptidivorans]|uniref:histidine kinase n=1 Tax=Natronincola peptidivorans TaxID=426128 RepID=A0A1I0A1Q9_9FIRM|nr:transporter substrate-binding domain-containing protein [Natronincola peptidivorans]SES88062.1 amino acid-binding domain sensor histidine kinase [Natronincola peptidivorans]